MSLYVLPARFSELGAPLHYDQPSWHVATPEYWLWCDACDDLEPCESREEAEGARGLHVCGAPRKPHNLAPPPPPLRARRPVAVEDRLALIRLGMEQGWDADRIAREAGVRTARSLREWLRRHGLQDLAAALYLRPERAA